MQKIQRYLIKYLLKQKITNIILLLGLFTILINTIYTNIYNKNIIKENKKQKIENIEKNLTKNSKIYFIYNQKKFTGSIFIKNKNKSYWYNTLPIASLTLYQKILIDKKINYYWTNISTLLNKYPKLNLKKLKFLPLKIPLYQKIYQNFTDILLFILLLYIIEKTGIFSFGLLNSKFKIIYPEEIKGDINDLVGLENIKKNINSIKQMIKVNNKSINILFSGLPGTGKTKMASYLAKSLDIPLINGTGNVETGYVAGGSNVIKNLFKSANMVARYNNNKCIIFLDEAQVLLLQRNRSNSQSKWEDDSTNELLSNLDGINTNTQNQIIFIAASNFDDSNFKLDEAIERRFQQKLYFDLPNHEERIQIITNLMKNNNIKNIDIDYLASITNQFSPAKIELIFNEALLYTHYDSSKITTEILIKQFEINTIGHTSKKITKNKQKERELIIKHELGHFFCYLELLAKKYNYNKEQIIDNLKILKISSESINKYNVLGYVINIEEDNKLKTINDLEEEIIQLYGGVASEEFFYSSKDVSIGSFNDIEKITDILDLLINKLNVYNKSKINFNKLYSKSVLIQKNQTEIENKSAELFLISKNIIQKNAKNINILSKIMYEKWVLNKNDIIDLIHNNIIKLKN